MATIRNPYKGRLFLTTEEGTLRVERTAPEVQVEDRPDTEPNEAAAAAVGDGPRFVTGETVTAEPVTVESQTEEPQEGEEDETDGIGAVDSGE